jgi:hypothetical protein
MKVNVSFPEELLLSMLSKGSDHHACEPPRRAVGYGPSKQAPTRGERMAAKFVLKKGSTGKFR